MIAPTRLYRTLQGVCAQIEDLHFLMESVTWDELFNSEDLLDQVNKLAAAGRQIAAPVIEKMLPPIGSQEVWAAGVTYQRSRSARVAESSESGGADFYDRVYAADRPELFFKSTPHRVAGHGQDVRIRSDSKWSVPEPELGVAINSQGRVIGYTIGNDMSARDIEGENPLYLPQAKMYDQCCALGPSILLTRDSISPSTVISMTVIRKGSPVFEGSTTLESMKRTIADLVGFLFRDNSFPAGCILLTGTGVVPPDEFSLERNDQIDISIDSIGTLTNSVVQG